LSLSDAMRDKYQEPTKRQRFLAGLLRFTDKWLIGPFVRLVRDRLTARSTSENSVVVTPRPATELASVFRPSDNGGVYQRQCPTVISGSATWCDELARRAQQPVTPLPFGTADIEHAIVCGEGVIWKKTPSGIFAVEESLATAISARSILPLTRTDDKILHVDPDLPLRKLSPKYSYALLRQPWDNNYGHWIVECLPKVAILAEHYDITKLRFIVTRHSFLPPVRRMRQVCIDSLAAYGICPDQIVWLGREAVEVEHLLYALPLTIHPWVKAPRTVQILEELGDKIAKGHQGPRRIYSSRASAGRRRLLNESEILRVVRDFDVAIVDPGVMSFADQVRAFAHAELLIGNFGANLTNAVFSPRGITMFVLASQSMGDNFFWDLTNLKSGKYFCLHGAPTSSDPNSDFVIDPDEFRAFLKEQVLVP
jgi:Glycosyltransferase 61